MQAESPTDRRESRAYEWIRILTQSADRFAGTPAERGVADRVGEWMRDLGARDVALEPVASAPRTGLALALHAVVSLVGLWLGGFAGAVLAVLALWSFRGDLRRRVRRLSRLLPGAGFGQRRRPPRLGGTGATAGAERAHRLGAGRVAVLEDAQ